MKQQKVVTWLQKMFFYFMCYAMIGWIYEMIIERVRRWPLVNRGTMLGPWLPVYGTGALLFLVTIYPIIKNKSGKIKFLYIPLVFLGCMGVATLLELLTSYFCEWRTGTWPWQTYGTTYRYHFQSRIALDTSLRFGLGGTIFLYVLQPFFEKLTTKWEGKKLDIITIILAFLMIIDCVYSFVILKNQKENDPWNEVVRTREVVHSFNMDVKNNPYEYILYDNGDVIKIDGVSGGKSQFKRLSRKEMEHIFSLIDMVGESTKIEGEKPILVFTQMGDEISLKRNYPENETKEAQKLYKYLESKGIL